MLLKILLLSLSCSAVFAQNVEGSTRAMLDAMQQLLTGGGEYDPIYLDELFQCMDTINPQLRVAADSAWYGMVEYHDQNGVPGDEWGSCQGGACYIYWEQNATQQIYHNLTIYEPCNYASNMAYYHLTTEICKRTQGGEWSMSSEAVRASGEVYAHLAMGSAFWHGSHTSVGNIFDNKIIDILSWIMYQESIAHYPSASTPVVRDLQYTPRPNSAIEIGDQLTQMFITLPVEQWEAFIEAIDMPGYFRVFGSYVLNIFSLALDDATADTIIESLANLFNFPQEDYDFLIDDLMPVLRNESKGFNLTAEEKSQMVANFESGLIKMVYAFIWQEWVIGLNSTLIFDPAINEAGAELLPVINAYANSLNDFPIYDSNLQNAVQIYPGEEWCNPTIPHAKWHVEAAAGLTDLLLLADQAHRLTKPAVSSRIPEKTFG